MFIRPQQCHCRQLLEQQLQVAGETGVLEELADDVNRLLADYLATEDAAIIARRRRALAQFWQANPAWLDEWVDLLRSLQRTDDDWQLTGWLECGAPAPALVADTSAVLELRTAS